MLIHQFKQFFLILREIYSLGGIAYNCLEYHRITSHLFCRMIHFWYSNTCLTSHFCTLSLIGKHKQFVCALVWNYQILWKFITMTHYHHTLIMRRHQYFWLQLCNLSFKDLNKRIFLLEWVGICKATSTKLRHRANVFLARISCPHFKSPPM